VDDSQPVAKLVSGLLKELGCDSVDCAHDALHALELLRATMHRIVVCDFEMEPMTGLDLLKAVRADWRFDETCFLIMTAATEFDHVSSAHVAGVDGYIVKPFSLSSLQRKIGQGLEHRAEAIRSGRARRRWVPPE
jgi:two-component system chemotaxis response regulator CheY